MTSVKTRIRVAPDGTLTGKSAELPVGDHVAEILLLEADAESPRQADPVRLLARVRMIQEEVARLPVLDARAPDEIIGYNQRGTID